MSLEQRVNTLEHETNERLGRIEISVKNTQDGIKKLFLHSARHEQQIKSLDKKVDSLDQKVDSLDQKVDSLDQKVDRNQQETRERFDNLENRFDNLENRFGQLELLIRQSLPKH